MSNPEQFGPEHEATFDGGRQAESERSERFQDQMADMETWNELHRSMVLDDVVANLYDQNGVAERRRLPGDNEFNSYMGVKVRVQPIRPEGPRAFPLATDFAFRFELEAPVKPRPLGSTSVVRGTYEIDQRGDVWSVDYDDATQDGEPKTYTRVGEPLVEPQQQILQMLYAKAKGNFRRQELGGQ